MSLARAEKADFIATTPAGAAPMPPGGVFFAPASRQAEAAQELKARRYVVVIAPSTSPRGGDLREVIDLAVEGALALRGALPPSAPIDADAEATVRDQVLRARALGAAGIALSFPRLALRDDPLSVEESALIAAWIAASQRGSVVVLFDERDRDARVLTPRRLAELAASTKTALRMEQRVRESSIPPSGEVVKTPIEASPATVKEGALERALLPKIEPAPALPRVDPGAASPKSEHVAAPPKSETIAAPPKIDPGAAPPRSEMIAARRAIEPIAAHRTSESIAAHRPIEPVAAPPKIDPPAAPADEEDPPTVRFREQPPPPVMAMPRRAVLKKRQRPEAPPLDPSPAPAEVTPIELAPAVVTAKAAPAPVEPPAKHIEPPAKHIEPPAKHIEEPPPPAPEQATRRVVHAAEWRAHAIELDKARGPKPTSVIDRLFTSRYMPLIGALARGEVDGAVKSVIDAFRTNFEHSYREAFSALRVTGKRPPMVFDAPDVAARIGRLNGARAVKLLLVDAMRFDIGERVAARLAERLSGRAVCVDRTLLWSALPTTTPTQMALLARGPEGLREAEPTGEPEGEIIRGRAVGTVRRERIGSREVMKLDLVEARLRVAGAGYEDRIESLAEEVTQITIRYIETLPPRTLLFMFGDHGFRLPCGADGRSTGAATQGGVSPEEVLVPGHAWLIGGVH